MQQDRPVLATEDTIFFTLLQKLLERTIQSLGSACSWAGIMQFTLLVRLSVQTIYVYGAWVRGWVRTPSSDRHEDPRESIVSQFSNKDKVQRPSPSHWLIAKSKSRTPSDTDCLQVQLCLFLDV